jgi:thiaminase/transcriptional activator TenA
MRKEFTVIFVCLSLLSTSAVLAQNPPKTAAGLIAKHADAWYAATHHPFLDKVKDGTLPFAAFATWLGQDYYFAGTLLDSQCLVLMHAPRTDQGLLIGGLFALDSELSWFEANAEIYGIDLTQAVLPTCRTYKDFLIAMQYKPYVVQVTCIWALEKAYYDGWTTALPGAPQYQEFVERWTTGEFKDYVDALENAVNNAMASASKKDRTLAEVYFLWIARYEKDFWDMALTGE